MAMLCSTYVEYNHEAIIPKELFHQVQEEKLRRASLHKIAVTRKKNKEEKEKSKYSSTNEDIPTADRYGQSMAIKQQCGDAKIS